MLQVRARRYSLMFQFQFQNCEFYRIEPNMNCRSLKLLHDLHFAERIYQSKTNRQILQFFIQIFGKFQLIIITQ